MIVQFSVLGSSLRQRVVNGLRRRFKSIGEAENFFGVIYKDSDDTKDKDIIPKLLKFISTLTFKERATVANACHEQLDTRCLFSLATQIAYKLPQQQKIDLFLYLSKKLSDEDSLTVIRNVLKCIGQHGKEEVLDSLFSTVAAESFSITHSVKHYTNISLKAMQRLQANGKPNLVYRWPEALCRVKSDGCPILDIEKMPFGLMQYVICFYTCTNVMQVGKGFKCNAMNSLYFIFLI